MISSGTNDGYDRIGRVTLVKDIYGRYVGYQYYDTGLRKKLDYPGTAYDLNYKYDALGRVTQLKRLFFPMAEYEYDELSRRTLLTYGNDANIVYDYDIANQLRKISNNINDGNVIEFAYPQYDKVGNQLSMKNDDVNTQVYGYDKLYQLVSVDYNDGNETGYHYDTLGNRLDVNENGSVTYYWNNELNQYTQVGTENYSYDDNGNLIDDGVYKYYYDCENRLTDVNDGGDERIASYKYDWAGRRVRKITYDTTSHERLATSDYLYDGWHCIAEYDGDTGSCLRRFYYGPMIDEPVMMFNVSTYAKYYYHYDGLGSVTGLSDSAGEIVESYEYDVFGNVTITDPTDTELDESAVGNPYMFTGRRLDEETGLYYFRARYYEPELGRFLSPDPVSMYLLLVWVENPYKGGAPGMAVSVKAIREFLRKHPIGRFLSKDPRFSLDDAMAILPADAMFYITMNLYTYAGNNPLIYIDPYGLGFWGDVWKGKGWWGGLVIAPIGGLLFLAGAPVAGGITLGIGLGLVIAEGIEVVVGSMIPAGDVIESRQDAKDRQQQEAEDMYPVGGDEDGSDNDGGDKDCPRNDP